MSQEELAEQLDLSRQAIYKWECGESIPSLDKLKSIAALFQVSFDYLMDDSIEECAPPSAATVQPVKNIRRPVYFTGNEFEYDQVYLDVDLSDDEASSATETFFAFHTAKDALSKMRITDLLPIQEVSNTHFFYDAKREVIGFFYAGMIQFICPLENVLGFDFDGQKLRRRGGSTPMMGVGFGPGGTSMMVGRGPAEEETLDLGVWATLTYQDGDEIKDFSMYFGPLDALLLEQLGSSYAKQVEFMSEVFAKSLAKNLAHLRMRLSALQEKANRIRSGALKVKDVDYSEFATFNEELEEDYQCFKESAEEMASENRFDKAWKGCLTFLLVLALIGGLVGLCIYMFASGTWRF